MGLNMNKEARKRHADFMWEMNFFPKVKPTPFDNPRSLRERIAYPLTRMAYQAGKSDGRQEGFNEGLEVAKRQPINRLSPPFSARHDTWQKWKEKWAAKNPSQHDRWVFDEGLRAGVALVLHSGSDEEDGE